MNTVKTELCELKAKAIAIIKAAIAAQPNHQYVWTLVGGRRLIFERIKPLDDNSELRVWHELKEGQKELEADDLIELSAEEWIEAASKWQRKCVGYVKQYLLIDGEIVAHADIEAGDEERRYGWIDYNLRRLKLREGVEYKLTMKREEQVMTVAEAEIRRFQQIYSGSAKWNLQNAEGSFDFMPHWTGLGETWFMVKELD